MSRTIKKLPYRYLRHMKGRRQALIRGDRSVPPDPYGDYRFDHETTTPWRLAWRMASEGRGSESIQRVLHNKWGISNRRAMDMARHVIDIQR